MTAKAATASNKADRARFAAVGKLHHFGLTHRWQVALVMPEGYDNYQREHTDAREAPEGERIVLRLSRLTDPRTTFRSGAPLTRLAVRDAAGNQLSARFFGNDEIWRECFAAPSFVAQCQVDWYKNELNVLLHQPVDPTWMGRLRARYRAKPGVMTADEVRQCIEGWLPGAIAPAAVAIAELLAPLGPIEEILKDPAVDGRGWTLEQLLLEAHMPASVRMGEFARQRIKRLAALGSFMKAQTHQPSAGVARAFPDLATVEPRARALPFALNAEQQQAVHNVLVGLARPEASRHLLVGDVGTGKTACFGVAAAAVADAGGKVAVLAPNLVLAEQIRNEFREAWPDLQLQLVTGESSEQVLPATQIAIGTTALLNRARHAFDFVVVDEEQKFSVDQKVTLAAEGAHLLTVSATPLPRSLALARYGAVAQSELREQHTPKFIETRHWTAQRRGELFDELRYYLRGGGQLLVVYPLREEGFDEGGDDGAPSGAPGVNAVHAARGLWEQVAPGQVRVLTGEDSDERKSEVIADMREKRAQVLLATTVVEVGVTLPALRRLLVVDPERHGVMTLHQLRGRVARKGGEGWCDLYSANQLTPKQQAKIEGFLSCKDGFEVAELDLRLRGHGDLGVRSAHQSGADRTFLFNDPVTVEDMAAVEPAWHRLRERGAGQRRH